jgi:hypothetical protein
MGHGFCTSVDLNIAGLNFHDTSDLERERERERERNIEL